MLKEPERITCPNPRCQTTFENLIVVSDRSKTPAERYYGCPNCLMHLDIVSITTKREEIEEKEEIQEDTSVCEKPETKVESPPGCPHHFGYLSIRSKDEEILQDCLTCRRVLECMLQIKIPKQ